MIDNKTDTIYIVDDDPDDRQIILDAFIENNSQLDYVFIESADELIKSLDTGSEKPSLILLDLNMPGMYGLKALKQIKNNKSFSDVPIIVLTTSSLQKDRITSYEMGANCFLIKPGSFDEMVKMIGSILTLWFPAKKS